MSLKSKLLKSIVSDGFQKGSLTDMLKESTFKLPSIAWQIYLLAKVSIL
jgi:hypothetical protein